jgi:hypothetical protein
MMLAGDCWLSFPSRNIRCDSIQPSLITVLLRRRDVTMIFTRQRRHANEDLKDLDVTSVMFELFKIQNIVDVFYVVLVVFSIFCFCVERNRSRRGSKVQPRMTG